MIWKETCPSNVGCPPVVNLFSYTSVCDSHGITLNWGLVTLSLYIIVQNLGLINLNRTFHCPVFIAYILYIYINILTHKKRSTKKGWSFMTPNKFPIRPWKVHSYVSTTIWRQRLLARFTSQRFLFHGRLWSFARSKRKRRKRHYRWPYRPRRVPSGVEPGGKNAGNRETVTSAHFWWIQKAWRPVFFSGGGEEKDLDGDERTCSSICGFCGGCVDVYWLNRKLPKRFMNHLTEPFSNTGVGGSRYSPPKKVEHFGHLGIPGKQVAATFHQLYP